MVFSRLTLSALAQSSRIDQGETCRPNSALDVERWMLDVRASSRGGPVAQRLEQGTHNPLVPGSNPGGPSSAYAFGNAAAPS